MDPGSSSYNMSNAFLLKGELNLAVLEQSVNKIVDRHEVLRTTFRIHNGRPLQIIAPNLHLPLPIVDLSTLNINDQETRIRQSTASEAASPFDLSVGPLMRTSLLRLGETDHVFQISTHHIVSDELSFGVFFRELETVYASLLAGQQPSLPKLPLQYGDYAAWERDCLQESTLKSKLGYWVSQLKDAPEQLRLPTDQPRSPVATYAGAQHAACIPQTVVNELRSLGRTERTTLFTLLLACLKLLFIKWTDERDIAIGTAWGVRTHPETENLIGAFVNFLPLRTVFKGSETGIDILRAVKSTVLGALMNHECPFDHIVSFLNPNRSPGVVPLCNTAFHLLPYTDDFSFPNVQVERMDAAQLSLWLDMRIVAVELHDGVKLAIEYRPELFDAETIEHFCDSYLSLLAVWTHDPGATLDEFQISPSLRQQKERSLSRQRALSEPSDPRRPH
jgi:hypothetical protein